MRTRLSSRIAGRGLSDGWRRYSPKRRQLQEHIYELFHAPPARQIHHPAEQWRAPQVQACLYPFSEPRVLIMDNPFIGLDADTRDQLKELLKSLTTEHHLQIIPRIEQER